MPTTLITHGKIIDGTGKPAFNGSVLIEGDRIKDIFLDGRELPAADHRIDATGLAVSPGFIDMHSHSDWVLPVENHAPVLKCLVEQGVTTVIAGNCGISPAPMTKKAVDKTEILASIAIAEVFDYQWQSMADFLALVQKQRPIVNMAELVGHATVRYNVASQERGLMSQAELDRCLDTTRQALDEGACGLSFGLGYDPGMYSSLEELEAFCGVAAKAGKPVTVHMKALSKISPCYPLTSLSAHNIRALKETLAWGEKTGVKLQLSHFIFVGKSSWPTAPEALRLVDDARARGLDVMIDAFPYACGNTTILAPFPYWFLAELPGAFTNKFLKARLRLELTLGFKLVGFSYPDFQVMDIGIPGYEHLNGLTIMDIAREWNCSPFAAMLTVAEKSRGGALMLFHKYSGAAGMMEPLEAVLSKDYCLFETDTAIKGTGYPNPAAIGAFPRILGPLVRDRKLFSLEDAVRRMTWASAQRFGLTEIGAVQPGKAADLVIFDPEVISDDPGQGREPARRPKGIKQVFINGQPVVSDGVYLDGARYGRVLT